MSDEKTSSVEDFYKDVREIINNELIDETNQYIRVALKRVEREIIKTYFFKIRTNNGN